MKETSLLYNMKSHFPILRSYLESLQLKVKHDYEKKLLCFQSKTTSPGTIEPTRLDDIVCQVCNSGDNCDKNLIVYCSLCNVTVHQQCYVLNDIPAGDFICDLCLQFGPDGRTLRCPFCSCRGGVLRPTQVLAASSTFEKKNEAYSAFMKALPTHVECFWPDKYRPYIESIAECERNNYPSSFITYNNDEIKSLTRFDSLGDSKNPGGHRGKVKPKRKNLKSTHAFPNLKSNSNAQLPIINELIYDFYKQTFIFSEEELKHEPVPQFVWCHMSCLYWLPEIHIKTEGNCFEAKNISQVERQRFSQCCTLCKQVNGACISCNEPDCGVTFHVECARRAHLHLYVKNTGAHIGYCNDHTPLLYKNAMFIQEKREREDILKTIRAMRRFLRARRVELHEKEATIREEDEMDYALT